MAIERMRRLILFGALLAMMLCCSVKAAETGGTDSDQDEGAEVVDWRAALAERPLAHPFLLLTPTTEGRLKRLVEKEPYKALAARFRANIDAIAEAPVPERVMQGRRLLNVSRLCFKRVVLASLLWRIDKDPKALAVARDTMLAAAAFKDWNPGHFLDVAEMTAALAIGYDWCHGGLTEAERATIRAAIIEKGLRALKPGDWWIKATNNWGQVCHAGLVMGALVVRDEAPKLADTTIERALTHVHPSMKVYAPDGVYPEGPGYWSYGTTYNVMLIEALRSGLGTDGGLLEKHPGLLKSGVYMCHAVGPTGYQFSYSDGGWSKSEPDEAALYWVARERGEPGLVANLLDALGPWAKREEDPLNRSDRFAPLLLLWAPEEKPATANLPRSWTGAGENPVAMHRTGWSARDAWVGIKAGMPYVNHGHMDVGSFVYEARGKRWAEDLGGEKYGKLEGAKVNIWDRKPGGQRWTVFRHHSRSHNVLMVDGQGQRVKGKGVFTRQDLEGEARFSIMDLAGVYEGQLDAAARGIKLLPDGTLIVRDEVTPTKDGTIRWAMMTRAQVEIASPRLAKLTQGEETLCLHIDAPEPAPGTATGTGTNSSKAAADAPPTKSATAKPEGEGEGQDEGAAIAWTVYPATPTREVENPNKGMRMVGFTIPARAQQPQTIQVTLAATPPSNGAAAAGDSAASSAELRSWKAKKAGSP